MNKKEFKTLCWQILKTYGFRKEGKFWYRCEKKLLCGIELQSSQYGGYYINYYFLIGDRDMNAALPTSCFAFDSYSRLRIREKANLDVTAYTTRIEYEQYENDELFSLIDEAFANVILAPFVQGARVIRDHIELYAAFPTHKERIVEKCGAS